LKPLAENAVRAPGSGIRQIMNLALTMQGVSHLEVGEPDFPSPPHVIEAACEAARSGYTKYTANAGIPSLREAITEKLSRVNGDEVSPERITVTNGAVSGLMASVMAVAQAGDEVLLPDPGWPNYTLMCRALGIRTRFYPLRAKNGFLPDAEELVSFITPRTKAVAAILGHFEMNRSALVVTGSADRNLLLSARNLPGAKTLPADYLNVADLLSHRGLVMTVEAVRRAEALWGGERVTKRLAPIPEAAAATEAAAPKARRTRRG